MPHGNPRILLDGFALKPQKDRTLLMSLVVIFLVGVVVATMSGLTLGCVPGGLTPIESFLSLALAAVTGFALWRGTKGQGLPARLAAFKAPRPGFWGWLMLFVFALAALRSYLWLVFPAGDQWRIGSQYNIGDLALHWQMIGHLAEGARFWPENPIFAEGYLRYPAGINLFNALFVQLGFPLRETLVWTGLAGSALAAWALWRWAGAFGLALFLFSGGLGGWMVFEETWPFVPPAGSEWKNLFLAVFVTQRGFLWALAAGLVLLWQWRLRLQEGRAPLPFFAEFCLYAAMPLFHLHSFLFFSLLLAACFLFGPAGTRREFFQLALTSFVPASLLVWLVTGGFRTTPGMIGWAPGWMQGEHGLYFWWLNFGLVLPLFLWLAWVVARHGNRTERIFTGVSLAVLGICFLWRLAPWPWDNIKLMIWVWLALAPFLWNRIFLPLALPARSLLLVLLLGGGAVELFGGLSTRHFYDWVPRREWDETKALLADLTVKNTRVGILPDVPHPVALEGHAIMVGYPGHLWSHGYDYGEKMTALENFYTSGEEAPVLSRMTHVVVGPREIKKFGDLLLRNPPRGWRVLRSTENQTLLERTPPGIQVDGNFLWKEEAPAATRP